MCFGFFPTLRVLSQFFLQFSLIFSYFLQKTPFFQGFWSFHLKNKVDVFSFLRIQDSMWHSLFLQEGIVCAPSKEIT